MTKLMFVEGISGVGKSTTARALARELEARGLRVRLYEEFDHTNPIDFYSTAYLECGEYAEICHRFPDQSQDIHANTVHAGNAYLVRYCAGNTPLFDGALLAHLAEREFCYKPKRLVPMEKYTGAYSHVWRDFAGRLDDEWDVIVFDGSLIHHPVNDLIRNNDATADMALAHVRSLLDALGNIERSIFYFRTEDVPRQLTRARLSRGQTLPTDAQFAFWRKRAGYDMHILENMGEEYHLFDVPGGWENALRTMIEDTEKERL